MRNRFGPGACITLTSVLTLFAVGTPTLRADSPIRLQQFEGALDLSRPGVVPFSLRGEAVPLGGKFTGYGEVVFTPGAAGSMVGQGVFVLKLTENDVLVGVASWNLGAVHEGQRPAVIHFAWRDTVKLSDGRVLASTGRFAHERPEDMTANGIIAILIGLLAPAP